MAEDAVPNEQAKETQEKMDIETTTAENNTSRLMITKIVNENFKSYAGIQELGPFHKVIEATVRSSWNSSCNVNLITLFLG